MAVQCNSLSKQKWVNKKKKENQWTILTIDIPVKTDCFKGMMNYYICYVNINVILQNDTPH